MSGDSCGWCHEFNPYSVHYCAKCSHAAHLPRAACDCALCISQKLVPEMLTLLDEQGLLKRPESNELSFPE